LSQKQTPKKKNNKQTISTRRQQKSWKIPAFLNNSPESSRLSIGIIHFLYLQRLEVLKLYLPKVLASSIPEFS
jgi:hypothetical protein